MKYFTSILIFKYILLCTILNFNNIPAISQEVQGGKEINNSIQISGSTALFFGGFSISYERSIVQLRKYNLNIEGGFGGYYFFGDPIASDYKIPIQINNLIGHGRSLFEVSYGVVYFNNLNNYSDMPFKEIAPIFNIGYRFQTQNQYRGMVFRIFFGISTGFGISIGTRF